MKRLFWVILSVLLLSACNLNEDKYSDYEHYNLTNYNHKEYAYLRNFDGTSSEMKYERYAVAVLVPKYRVNELPGMIKEGLLYEVGKNDYILLDSYDSYDDLYDSIYHTLFYKDKLYIVRDYIIYEYVLNKENTEVKELEFDVKEIVDEERVIKEFSYIEKVDDEYIYLKGRIRWFNDGESVGDSGYINIKCSLNNYKCVEDK